MNADALDSDASKLRSDVASTLPSFTDGAVAEPVDASAGTHVEPKPFEITASDRGMLDWRRRYARYVAIADAIVIIWVVFGTQIAWLGLEADLTTRDQLALGDYSFWIFSTTLVVLWLAALALNDSRSYRVIGTGTVEFKRVFDASFVLFGAIAILAFLFRVEIARGFLLISLPLGVALLFLVRWMSRQWLMAQRAAGKYSARVLLVGSAASIAQVGRELMRTPSAGYVIVGSCLPSGDMSTGIPGTDIPVTGTVAAVDRAISETGADTIIVTSTDDLPPDKVKEISWALEAGKQHLVLAPNIIDIAGPRIHTRPVSGLPLIHVETPRFTRGERALKRTFDVFAAALSLVLFSGVLIAVAVAVKLSSTGPVLYTQERIGLNGQPFRMFKFRSMRDGADEELAMLLKQQGTNTRPLFKVKNDPRITPVGRFLRKYSLDEFPQLLNVLGGSMSIVGPRPQIAAEVALYSHAARRRLLTRPGITGLWQVSGRSTLDWSDAVRLDLYYVENWSLISDLAIVWKTARAVLSPGETAH